MRLFALLSHSVSVKKCRRFLCIRFVSATLLHWFTTARSRCVTSLGCSVYTVSSSAWHHSMLFPSNLDTFSFCFFFFFWLLWLGFPISCWIEVVLGGIWICSSFQWGGSQLVTSEPYVGCGLVLHCLFPSLLWEECLWWMVLNCMKRFSCICGDDHVIFVFSFVDVLGHIDWWTLNHPSEPEMNPTWSWCMILFYDWSIFNLKCCDNLWCREKWLS